MKKTWDNLKVGDKFYAYDACFKEWETCFVKDIGSNGYIVFSYKELDAKCFTESLETIKKEYSLIKSPMSKTLALIAYKENRIINHKDAIETWEGYIKETNKKIIKVKEEIKNLKQQLKEELNGR